jgi:hypothetical protein
MIYEDYTTYLDELHQEQEDSISIALEADGASDGYRGIPIQSNDLNYIRGYNLGSIARADEEWANFQSDIKAAKQRCDEVLKQCRAMNRELDNLKFQDWLDENF